MHEVIRLAATPADFGEARALFEEYAAWLQVDLCFQGFAEELATLPGAYAPPSGRLLLAAVEGHTRGCVGLRPLIAASASAGPVGEVKRLYVQPAARGIGLGLRLASAIIDEARTIGYRELKLDTLERMREAQALYARLGFRPCAPYYRNPLPGTVYLALLL